MRTITEVELQFISGGQTSTGNNDDIVIVGILPGVFGFYGVPPQTNPGGGTGSLPPPIPGNNNPWQIGTPSDGRGPGLEISMKDHKHDKWAQEAFANVSHGLNETLTQVQGLDPATPVTFDGKNYTAGQLLNELNHTTFIITDAGFNNGGVGAAGYNPSTGFSVDKLNYASFSTTKPTDAPNTWTSYADPSYTDNAGVKAALLHELAHMAPIGYQFWVDSYTAYNKDTSSGSDFYHSPYSTNNEAFADDFVKAMANSFGIVVPDFAINGDVTHPVGAIDPGALYSQRHP